MEAAAPKLNPAGLSVLPPKVGAASTAPPNMDCCCCCMVAAPKPVAWEVAAWLGASLLAPKAKAPLAAPPPKVGAADVLLEGWLPKWKGFCWAWAGCWLADWKPEKVDGAAVGWVPGEEVFVKDLVFILVGYV